MPKTMTKSRLISHKLKQKPKPQKENKTSIIPQIYQPVSKNYYQEMA